MAAQAEVHFRFEVSGSSFDVVRFELVEALSQPFRLELDLSHHDPNLELETLLDADAVFTLARHDEPVRTVHGIVTAVEQGETGFRRTRYRAVVEPLLARLGLWHGSRIHQLQSVPEILSARLKERGLHTRINATRAHASREYCVQYRESDLAFFARQAAEEGLVWYFDPNDRSQLVLTDALPAGPRLAGHGDRSGPVRYQPDPGGDAREPHLWHVGYSRELAPTRVTQRDYTFHNPLYDLQHVAKASAAERAVGDYEHYGAPGRYKRDEAGKPFTRTRLSSLRNAAEVAHLAGDDARLWPGLGFRLDDHPLATMNRDWRVIAMHHLGEQATSQEADGADAACGTRYSFTAQAAPADRDWQPAPQARPVLDGPQIAHVVGPENEEIHCDEHGRVMVWFPWDREGPRENSTCWIRVSQGWAGTMYGFQAIPRIGHEVIVSHLEGDPDQPIITGRAYHAANRPPYELPRHKTRTTFKTQTHKGAGYNELRFEDEAGQEEIFVHAQKDRNIVVEHDETTRVVHDRSEDVGNDETVAIGHDRKETVGHDETLGVGQDRKETLGRDHTLDIGRTRQLTVGKDLIETVGNVRIEKTATDRKADTGGHYEHKVAGSITEEAGQSITQRTQVFEAGASDKLVLRGPGGTITIDDGGIRMEGLEIRLKGPVELVANGAGNSLAISGTPNEPVCLECLLKAIAGQQGVVKFGGAA